MDDATDVTTEARALLAEKCSVCRGVCADFNAPAAQWTRDPPNSPRPPPCPACEGRGLACDVRTERLARHVVALRDALNALTEHAQELTKQARGVR